MSGLGYDLKLVAKSLRRDRWFTAVMVVSQALGVSIFVTALVSARRYSGMAGQVEPAVYRVESSKESLLRRFFRKTQFEGFGEYAAVFVNLPATRALTRTGAPDAQTSSFVSVLAGGPADAAPDRLAVRFCNADLFDLFHVDFRYGRPWRRAEEKGEPPGTPPARVVVLSDLLNDRLFGGRDSVGRTIRLAGRDFQVVGVVRQRSGKIHLWDLGLAPEYLPHVMVPFPFADELRPVPVVSWPPVSADQGWAATAASGSAFAEYWVRLPTAEGRARFAAAMRAVDPELTLRSADEIVSHFSHPPAPYRVFVILTLVVMEASVINVMRMLAAKASSRAAEIGIHRALGAGRETIFVRQLLEGVVVSFTGSVLGLALAIPTVRMFDHLIPDSPVQLALTPTTVATALLVCALAGLVTSIYPAWRVASVSPTRYLGKV
jgi:putative ABC transport system permease protein